MITEVTRQIRADGKMIRMGRSERMSGCYFVQVWVKVGDNWTLEDRGYYTTKYRALTKFGEMMYTPGATL